MANSRTKTRAKSQETRNNIIAVAIGLFRTKGYTRTSMSEIARQAELILRLSTTISLRRKRLLKAF